MDRDGADNLAPRPEPTVVRRGAIVRRFMCNVLGHYRNRHRARFKLGAWRSSCLVCGQHMVRVAPGQWSVATELPQVAPIRGTEPWRPPTRRCHCDYWEPDRAHWVLRDLFDLERETE